MRTHTTRHLSSSSGFTLLEMMIAISVAGLLLALTMPRLRETLVARDVKSARAMVANMYARARVNALQTRKPTTVHFTTTESWVTTPLAGTAVDTVGAVVNLYNAYGVDVAASVPSIRVLPTGLANMAATATVKVSRNGKSDSVMISGYGRLQ